MTLRIASFTTLLILSAIALEAQKPRARDLGVPFSGTSGALNAITDVAGVEVGHATLISGEGKLVRGSGPVRTGVTVVSPDKIGEANRFYGAFYAQNGNGEMTGTTWLEESGMLEGAVFITNTHAVGTVRDAYIAWQVQHAPPPNPARFGETVFSLPIVAETWDGYLNDIYGFHVKPEHVTSHRECEARRPASRGQRRRWHRHGLLRIQGRHRHIVPKGANGFGSIHGRRAGAV
jgi:D-aminopeptidase